MIRLAAFLSPRSIALVGCPRDLSRPGARPLVYLKKHGVVIMTSGFGEIDSTGAARKAKPRATADAAGLTVLGPNMLGFVNCWDRVPLTNARVVVE